MRVAIYSPSVINAFGGTEVFIRESAKRLSRLCDLELIVGKPLDEKSGEVAKDIGVKCFFYPYLGRNLLGEYFQRFETECLSFFLNSHWHFQEHEYDVVHAHYPTDMILKSVLTSPLVVHLHGVRILQEYHRNLLKRFPADKYLACSQYIADRVMEELDIEVEAVHNGVDVERFKPVEKESAEKLRVFSSGRITEGKGFENLIQAFRYVEEKDKDITLTIAGDGTQMSHLREMVKKFNLKNVEFLGYIPYEKIHTYYPRYDLFVDPHPAEPFGLVIIEAMASGIPAIAGAGGPKEIITEDTGFIVNTTKPEEIAEAILHAKEENLAELGKKARKRVEENFTWEIVSKKLYRIYKEISE